MNIQIKNQQSAISNQQLKGGFSLMEVLIAVGTLALGMLFIASVFPAGLHWTTVSSERTIAAVVADEAFAKIKLYGILLDDPDWIAGGQTPIESVSSIYSGEYGYPSYGASSEQKKYWWSAICQKIDTNDVQVTVFISRRIGTGTKYYRRNMVSPFDFVSDSTRPVPVFMRVFIVAGDRPDEIRINDPPNFINDGYTIVDDATGQIYRILERYSTISDKIRLDKNWQGTLPGKVWVVPPPAGGGRYPCIAVYQKVLRF